MQTFNAADGVVGGITNVVQRQDKFFVRVFKDVVVMNGPLKNFSIDSVSEFDVLGHFTEIITGSFLGGQITGYHIHFNAL